MVEIVSRSLLIPGASDCSRPRDYDGLEIKDQKELIAQASVENAAGWSRISRGLQAGLDERELRSNREGAKVSHLATSRQKATSASGECSQITPRHQG